MAENSYLSFLSDPASDMFGSLNGADEGGFLSSLQPSLISQAAANSYQPLESESIMTLGEPSTPSKPQGPSPSGHGLSYTQLGLSGTSYHPLSASFPPHQPTHAPHRYPGGYYAPGGSQYPATSQPQRFGHDPYRQTQFSPYGAGSNSVPQPGQNPSWPTAPVAVPPSQNYLTPQSAQMRPPYGSHQGYPEGQSPFVAHPQQQFSQGNAGATAQSFQGMRMMAGYGGGMVPAGMPGQQPFASPLASQYSGYPGQQAQGMPQNRLPGMPYSVPQQMSSRFTTPHSQPPNMPQNMQPSAPSQQSQRLSGLLAQTQRIPGPPDMAGMMGKQSMSEARPPSMESKSTPSPSTHSDLGRAAGQQGAVGRSPTPQNQSIRSPESPGMRPPGPPLAGSPLPSMFNQPNRMAQPGQFQSKGPNSAPPSGMMGPPTGQMMSGAQAAQSSLPGQRPPGPQSFPQGQPMMPGSGAPGFQMSASQPPMYQNGPMMSLQNSQQLPGALPSTSLPNIAGEMQSIQIHLQSLLRMTNRPAEVDKKITELQNRLMMLSRQQAAVSQTVRPSFTPPNAPVLPPNGPAPPGMCNPGMPGAPMHPPLRPVVPLPPMSVAMGMDQPRPPPPQVPMQNGFNGHSAKENALPPPAPLSPQSGGAEPITNDTASQSDDEGTTNKYATPKKKRNRGSSSANRKRKSPSSASKPAEGEGTPSKARNRSSPKGGSKKAKPPPKTAFQFGRKKKKKRGSDDEGDDLDATPPPSPSVVEQDFDGNYVEKRRSARVTKRKKYTDEGDMDMSDADDRLPGQKLAEEGTAVEEESDGAPVELFPVEIFEPPKRFFVQPGDPDPIVVEKIMSHRMGKRPLAKPDDEAPKEEEADAETDEPAAAAAKKSEEAKPGEMVEVEEYYVKFKNYSYLHCDWKTTEELEVIDKRIKQKITRYKQKKENANTYMDEADDEPFDPNYTEVDRLLDERMFVDGEDARRMRRYFLVKWCALPYDECSWEVEEDCDTKKVEEYRRRQMPPPPAERKRFNRPGAREWAKMDKAGIYKNGNLLRDYQLEGVNWLLFSWYHGQNCILADEMGLGKTVQSTVFLEHIRRFGIRGPFLVVVPLSTLGNWVREVETWTEMNGICYHGGSLAREVLREYEFYFRNERGQKMSNIFKFNIFITTYEILLSDLEELREIEWRAVIIDEAHRLKNKNCKLLEGLKLLDLEHRVLLTGTPLQNNVEELFSLLNFLEPDRFSNAEAFSLDFGDLKTDDQVHKLQQILKPMMLRRLKEDVEKSIAPKEETIIEVELTNMQKKWYRAILEKNFTFLAKGSGSANVPNLMNTMMELRKCCNHPYLLNGAEEAIIEEFTAPAHQDVHEPDVLMRALVQSSGKLVLIDKLLPKLKDGGHKVLVFSQMVRCLDILEDYLVQKRYLFERIDGRVRGPERQAAIDRFSREDSDRFVFLLCTRAGGLGINLTAADTVIIFDSDWNPQNDLQAQARCHRIGQDKPVKVYRLITRNSYEREMFDKASLKLGLDKAVLQSGQMAGASATAAAGAGKEAAFAQAQQQLSKSDIEDLLKRGAYGALMDDDNAADQFCTEDIEQILQRRTQTVQLEAGEKGSTFSKASFAATGTRDDIDINDPDFWQKWAKKAEVNTDKDVFENELIIHEPRRRLQVRRYGEEVEEEIPEEPSEDEEDSDEEGGRGRRGRRGRKGKGKEKDDAILPGSWNRMECLRLERGLLAWGWGRWKEVIEDVMFKRKFSEKDVELFARTMMHYCCKHYTGSDDKAKPDIWDLVLKSYKDDWAARRAFQQEQAAVAEETGGRKKNQKRSTRKAETPEPELENGEMPDWDKDERFEPEKLLDNGFLKHMKKHSINRLVLRLKLLQNLKDEAIRDLGELIMVDTPYQDIPLEMPTADGPVDKPVDWWDEESDKCLVIGIYKHGFENYGTMRNDPNLCFLSKCGPQEAPLPLDMPKDITEEGDAEAEEARETESTDEPEAGPSKRKTREKAAIKEKEEEASDVAPVEAKKKPGRGRKPAAARRQAAAKNGEPAFPLDSDLNTRVRRLILAFEKRRLRLEQLEIKKQQRLERQLALEKEREARKLEQQQKRWTKREEGLFAQTVVNVGVEYGESREVFEWDRFRELAHLDKKLDSTLTDYYTAFHAMLKKVCGKKISHEEDMLADQVEQLPEERAARCLQRIDLLYRIRLIALKHPKLDERLKLCQPSPDLPDWWICGQHDREILEGAARHGLAETACNMAVDCDFSFAESIKAAFKAKESAPSSPKPDALPIDESVPVKEDNKPETNEEEADKTEGSDPVKEEESAETDEKPAPTEDTEEKSSGDESGKKEAQDDTAADADVDMKEEKVKVEAEEGDQPGELTVAQLLAKGMCAKGWPSDRVIQARLEHICYCIDHNRWPSKRTQAAMADAILDEGGVGPAAAAPPPTVPTLGAMGAAMQPFNPQDFLDNPDFAMLAAAGHIPGLNGMEPRRGRRGRRPKAEIEAERLAQYHAAQQALLQQQQAFLSAATANAKRMRTGHEERRERDKGKDRERERDAHRSPSSRQGPPPAHGRSSNNSMAAEMEGVLDLTGKGRASGSGRKEPLSGEKGSKLSQKVDTLLKKRRQEAEHNAFTFDPDGRVPVINMRDGSILQGDKAPRQKDLADWLTKNPHYVVDTQAFGMPAMSFPDIFTNGASSSKRSMPEEPASSSRDTGLHLTGEENVTVIHRKTGKKIAGRKAPQLKSLGEWLESNHEYDIDPAWTAILREQGATASASTGKEKRGRKSAANSAAAAGDVSSSPSPNLFAGNPFGPAFSMGAGALGLPGFGGRFPMAFPGLPGFPLPSALMGMLPGMGDGETGAPSLKGESSGSYSKKGDTASTPSSSSSKGRERDRDRETTGTSRKSKADKEKQQQQQQAEKEQQQALESMMQSQLPFIFPQAAAGLFGGFNPLFAQAAAAGFPGFPFSMGPSPLLNGFGDMPPEKAATPKEKRGGRGAAASPAESSSSSRTHERERERTSQRERDKEERPSSGRPRGRPPRNRDREEAGEARRERRHAKEAPAATEPEEAPEAADQGETD